MSVFGILRSILLLMAVGITAVASAAERRPNVVFFFIDDLGWRDLEFMGSSYYETPNVDRLAREGMVFDNAYANAPNCAPSRACLMSGLYGPRHGVYTVGNPARGQDNLRQLIPTPNNTVLENRFVTIPEVLKEAGYVTATMGKWHLGPDPGTQGFDVNVGGNHSGSPRGGYFSPWKNPQLANGPEGEYLTDRLTDEAVAFVREHRDRPFFLYLTHYAVHTPIQGKKAKIEKYRKKPGDEHHNHAEYAAMVESMDESVGRVLAEVEKLGLSGDTVVVFFSDNGGYGPATSMAPLRGSKGMLYEGGIRVPLVIKWPGKTKPGSRSSTPVIGTDLFPTLIGIAGASAPGNQKLDGVNLAPVLTGEGAMMEQPLFWHFPAYLQAYRGINRPFRTRPAGAIRMGDWKLIEFFEDGRLELYNLREDIGETKNLAKAMPEKTAELLARMKQWRGEVKAPIPTEPNPKYDPNAKWRKRRGR